MLGATVLLPDTRLYRSIVIEPFPRTDPMDAGGVSAVGNALCAAIPRGSVADLSNEARDVRYTATASGRTAQGESTTQAACGNFATSRKARLVSRRPGEMAAPHRRV